LRQTGEEPSARRPSGIPPAGEDAVSSALFFGSPREGDPARFLTLLSVDEDDDTAAIIYIPAATAVEVPGRGLLGVGEALEGGVPLLRVAAENLLGIEIDAHVHLTAADTERLMATVAPLEVDVPREVKVAAGRGRARIVFRSGAQRLSASNLTQLLFTPGLDGDQVELGSRHLAVWDGLLDAYEDSPEALGEQVRAAATALERADVPGDEIAALLEMVAATAPERRTLSILPVRQVSVGGGELYAADRAEIEAFLAQTLGGTAADEDLIAVQILNGNGVPGIGQEAAERLVGNGFRVALTGNAPRLDYKRTLIVTYDRSEAGLDAARRAKALLRVGRVQVSAQEQGSVDLTIVIGKDFLRSRSTS
ncbi:MAG TPA: LCP family protein, partial [Actinomycetota bacterium]|nr:LCP family protein [Actinomycetota bacterium]